MLVVADTSPLNYLVLIGQERVLPLLYQEVMIPHAVLDELLHARTSAPVRSFAQNPPHWLRVATPSRSFIASVPGLDYGETEAIALAEELDARWLLMDETAGRAEATRRGRQVTGTLGVLRSAARMGLLDLVDSIERLRLVGFHVSQRTVDIVLRG